MKIKQLGSWICHQLRNYLKNEQIMRQSLSPSKRNKYRVTQNVNNKSPDNIIINDDNSAILTSSTVVSPLKYKAYHGRQNVRNSETNSINSGPGKSVNTIEGLDDNLSNKLIKIRTDITLPNIDIFYETDKNFNLEGLAEYEGPGKILFLSKKKK
jgi:hypothetical protein